MPPKRKAARSSEHLVELLLFLAFSRASIFGVHTAFYVVKSRIFPMCFQFSVSIAEHGENRYFFASFQWNMEQCERRVGLC